MKPEDYPLVEFEGVRLRRCPELMSNKPKTIRSDCCAPCVAYDDAVLCDRISSHVKDACSCVDANGNVDDTGCVFVPEENFNEYVVEWVRRRIS